tara:strand:+ start:966 stop:1094 length:129 start_codon:yes stop_codon:yes gene_type:complete
MSEGWVEADGTEYVLREDGNYDVIPPKKSKAKPKAKAKKSTK